MFRERQRQGRIDSWEKPILKGQAQESPAKENVLPSLKLTIVSKFLFCYLNKISERRTFPLTFKEQKARLSKCYWIKCQTAVSFFIPIVHHYSTRNFVFGQVSLPSPIIHSYLSILEPLLVPAFLSIVFTLYLSVQPPVILLRTTPSMRPFSSFLWTLTSLSLTSMDFWVPHWLCLVCWFGCSQNDPPARPVFFEARSYILRQCFTS